MYLLLYDLRQDKFHQYVKLSLVPEEIGLADGDQIEEFSYFKTPVGMEFQEIIIFSVGMVTPMLYPLPKSEMQGLASAFLKEEAAGFYKQFLKKTKIFTGKG